MLTIPVKQDRLIEIARGNATRDFRELSPYWTPRVVHLLGFADDDTPAVLDDLRAGEIKTEHEVLYQGGYNAKGSPQAVAVVTVRIMSGRFIDDAAADNDKEYFVFDICEVKDVSNIENITPPPAAEDNAVVISKTKTVTGFCKFCHNARFVEVPESVTELQANEYATAACDCDDARRAREREMRMKAAAAWAENIFSKSDGQLRLICSAIQSTFDGSVDKVTVKIAKRNHIIDTDKDGMIRIRTTYRDSNEETF